MHLTLTLILTEHGTNKSYITGYKHSVTGCESQRKQCICYSAKTNVNSMILILKFDFVEHHTHFYVYVS